MYHYINDDCLQKKKEKHSYIFRVGKPNLMTSESGSTITITGGERTILSWRDLGGQQSNLFARLRVYITYDDCRWSSSPLLKKEKGEYIGSATVDRRSIGRETGDIPTHRWLHCQALTYLPFTEHLIRGDIYTHTREGASCLSHKNRP